MSRVSGKRKTQKNIIRSPQNAEGQVNLHRMHIRKSSFLCWALQLRGTWGD